MHTFILSITLFAASALSAPVALAQPVPNASATSGSSTLLPSSLTTERFFRVDRRRLTGPIRYCELRPGRRRSDVSDVH